MSSLEKQEGDSILVMFGGDGRWWGEKVWRSAAGDLFFF